MVADLFVERGMTMGVHEERRSWGHALQGLLVGVLTLVLAMGVPAVALADELGDVAGEETTTVLVAQADDDIASGTCGTCDWVIDASGTLTIGPGALASGDSWPWQYTDITSVVFEPGVVAGADVSRMFMGCESVVSVNTSGWDTSQVTNMHSMFHFCSSLTTVDVSSWDTSQVTDMGYMFSGCMGLKELDVSSWDTSQVTDMNDMFYDCESLRELDVANWNVSRVTGMGWMFFRCSSLESLDVSRWDTSNVTVMGGLFEACNSLRELDVSEWDTSKATSMNQMFGSKELQSLDVSKWNTSLVKSMYEMFSGCESIKALDLSMWDTSKVEDAASMFWGCNALSIVRLGEGYVIKSADMLPDAMTESGWYSIADKTWYTKDEIVTNRSGVADTYRADDNIASGTCGTCPWYITADGTLTIGAGTLASNDEGDSLFWPWGEYDESITSVVAEEGAIAGRSLSSLFGSRIVTDSGGGAAAGGVSVYISISSVDLSNLDTSQTSDMSRLFSGCPKLESVNLSGFDTSNVGSEGSANMWYVLDGPMGYFGFAHIASFTVGSNYVMTNEVSGLIPTPTTEGGSPSDSGWWSTADKRWYSKDEIVANRSGIADTYLVANPNPDDLSNATISGLAASYAATGLNLTPEPTVAIGGTTLTKGKDYRVSYAGNRKVGTATVTVTGIGAYSGTKTATFEVTPRIVDLASETWRFDNFKTDTPISLALCRRMYGMQGHVTEQYLRKMGDSGVCYGMVAAAQSVSLAGPAVSTFGVSSLSSLSLGSTTSAYRGMTVRDLIYLGQIAQVDSNLAAEYNANKNFSGNRGKLSRLVEAVSDFENGGAPVSILVYFQRCGHAVWALRVASDDDSATTIAVYDPNWPGEEHSVRLLKSSGAYSGWEFAISGSELWGTTTEGPDAKISWATPGDDLWALANRNARPQAGGYTHLLSVPSGVTMTASGTSYQLSPDADVPSSVLLEVPIVGVLPDGSSSSDDGSLWWANTSDTVAFSDISEKSTVAIASSESGVTAEVAGGSTVTTTVSKKSADKVTIKQKSGSEFEVSYFGGKPDDVTISGTGAGTVNTAVKGTDYTVTGVTSLTVEAEGEKPLTKKNLTANTVYTVITEDFDGETSVTLGNIANATIKLKRSSFPWTGRPIKTNQIKPTVMLKVTENGKTENRMLKEGTDYTVSYPSGRRDPNSYSVTVKGKGKYGGKGSRYFTINKLENPMKVKAKRSIVRVSLSKVQKAKQTLVSNVAFTKKAKGKVTYKNVSTNRIAKKFTVNESNGKITVLKGTKKGRYSVILSVTAAGDNRVYKPSSPKKVRFTVEVK